MHILAIIPARGGSKGIPLKNLQKLAGKPLIEYTIQSAKKSKKIDRIIVSTDNENIAKTVKKLGIQVPFLRPKNIAKSNSPAVDYVKHALKFLSSKEKYVPNIVIILQPTSPIRKEGMIDKSILILKKSRASCVISATKIKTHPYFSFRYDEKKYLKPFKSDFQKYFQRQKFPDLFYPTGGIYTFWSNTLKKYDSIYGPRIKPLIIDQEDSVDIDNVFDLFISEMRLLFWEKYKKKIFSKYMKRL